MHFIYHILPILTCFCFSINFRQLASILAFFGIRTSVFSSWVYALQKGENVQISNFDFLSVFCDLWQILWAFSGFNGLVYGSSRRPSGHVLVTSEDKQRNRDPKFNNTSNGEVEWIDQMIFLFTILWRSSSTFLCGLCCSSFLGSVCQLLLWENRWSSAHFWYFDFDLINYISY